MSDSQNPKPTRTWPGWSLVWQAFRDTARFYEIHGVKGLAQAAVLVLGPWILGTLVYQARSSSVMAPGAPFSIWDALPGIGWAVAVFLLILLVNVIRAPFRLHYERLRGHCPDGWLHALVDEDWRELRRRIHTSGTATIQTTTKRGPLLEVRTRLVNGSVFDLKIASVSGRPRLTGDLGEHVLPEPSDVTQPTIKHGESGRIVMQFFLDEALINTIIECWSRQAENHNSGVIGFGEWCQVVVRLDRFDREATINISGVEMRDVTVSRR